MMQRKLGQTTTIGRCFQSINNFLLIITIGDNGVTKGKGAPRVSPFWGDPFYDTKQEENNNMFHIIRIV